MNRIASLVLGALTLLLASLPSTPAAAQSGCPYIAPGAVLTAGQWNFCFASKTDNLGYVPLNPAAVVAVSPIVATPGAGTLQLSCPTCVTGGSGTVRTLLTGPATYYANASTGLDANPCTVGSPCQSAQRLIDLQKSIDNQGYPVALQLVTGSPALFPAGVVCNGPFVGGGVVTLQGDTTTWTNVVLNNGGTGVAVQAMNGCFLTVTGMQLKGSSDLIQAANKSFVTAGLIDFAAGASHYAARGASNIIINNNVSISGTTAAAHGISINNSVIQEQNISISFSNNVAFSAGFIQVNYDASAKVTGLTYVLNGHTITGPRFDAEGSATLFANGGCGSFPGNSVGTTSTQGQCF